MAMTIFRLNELPAITSNAVPAGTGTALELYQLAKGQERVGKRATPVSHSPWLRSRRAVPMSPKCPTIAAIQAAVAARFRVTVLDLLSARRGVACARPRQAAMWLCRHATLHTLSEIGRQFGDRDHKTVLNAIRRADQHIAAGGDFADAACGLLAALSHHSGLRIAA